jgi:hypothetical protein
MDTKRATISDLEVREGPDLSLPTGIDLVLKAPLLQLLRGWMEDLNRETDLRHHLNWEEEVNEV